VTPSAPLRAANAFVVAYGADALLTLFLLMLGSESDLTLVVAVQRLMAVFAVIASLLCVPLLTVCARLPVTPLLVLCASVGWMMSGGAPLPLWFALENELPIALAVIQTGLFAGTLLWFRRLNGGSGWLLSDAMRPGPKYSLGHTLRVLAVMLFVLVPLGMGYIAVSLATWLEVGTEGFVQVDLAGVQLADRRYARDASEVRLVGMMHLGEDATYRALAESFMTKDTIVLEEGVSDHGAVLGRGLSYEGLANTLGLEAQQSIGSYLHVDGGGEGAVHWPVIRNADVDAEEFSRETVEYLALAANFWSGDPMFEAFFGLYEHAAAHPELAEVFLHDIIELRNRHLLAEMEIAMAEFSRVIVPWGALHLPEVERELIAEGFVFENETRRQVVAWSTVLAALL
jgi:hypothetical protein